MKLNMKIGSETLIGDIVRTNYSAARVFENHGIDYCCGGNIPINHACSQDGIDENLLIRQLEALLERRDRSSEYIENLPLTELSDYIVETHHGYIHDTAPFIREKLKKLCEVHGDHHPELSEIREMFDTASVNLLLHMEKEETILFPYIRDMENLKLNEARKKMKAEKMSSPIHQFREEHQAEGDRFRKMSEITNNFRVPADGCNTYQVTYRTLDEFVKDLHRHIHLENNVLFPKFIKLEKELMQKS